MNYYKDNNIFSSYLYEFLERIVRFYQHLDEVSSQFFREDETHSSSNSENIYFIDSYKSCLLKFFEIAIGFYAKHDSIRSGNKIDLAITQISENIQRLGKMHEEWLKNLPRPKTPVELQRFSRIINKQHEKARTREKKSSNAQTETKKMAIYLSEKLNEETHFGSPITEFKVVDINNRIEDFNTFISSFQGSPIQKFVCDPDYMNYSMSLPRIDANNPCRWPTLIHELAHHILILREESANPYKEFKKSLDVHQKRIIRKYEQSGIKVKQWLNECWCDLLATLIIGPAFWFSQFSAFLMDNNSSSAVDIIGTHPPALFRLKLIKRLIDHRIFESFRSIENFNENVSIFSEIIEHLDKSKSKSHSVFYMEYSHTQLYILFRSFFFKVFFSKNYDGVSEFLNPFAKYTLKIDGECIKKLISNISQGRPIPSKPRKQEYVKIFEEPASLQDILIAAWLYRNNQLKNRIIERIRDHLNSNDILSNDVFFKDRILNEFSVFDQIVLKSIQVSEWFDLFDPFENSESFSIEDILPEFSSFKKKSKLTKGYRFLNDKDIFDYLESDKLKIIPIISLKDQLGTSSFDIRLGTTFQLFYPNRTGIIDFTNKESIKNYNISSELIDLDFRESITISQYQFMLSHSMEYIELPDDILAELEGRSSFARLGLEIHVTAGFIDPGFSGVLTFELVNNGPNPIKLFPGLRIAQLRFSKAEKPIVNYSARKSTKYKGLLSHNLSLQFKDIEMERLLKK